MNRYCTEVLRNLYKLLGGVWNLHREPSPQPGVRKGCTRALDKGMGG